MAMFTLYQTASALVHEPHPKGLLFYSRGSRGGPLLLLALDQTEARRAEKNCLWRPPTPLPLISGSGSLPPPPPPPRYLKVWIQHWLTHKNGDFGPISVTERSCSSPISNMFRATLWCNVNRYSLSKRSGEKTSCPRAS